MMDSNDESEERPLLEVVVPATGRTESFRSYPARWFILAILSILSLSNGMVWVSFSPIADSTAAFYDIDASMVNWLSIIFMVVAIPLGIFSIWFLDVVGLRPGIILASWLNGIGVSLRVISCLSLSPTLRYVVLMLGQGLCACAQPFLLFAPTKVAALWFPDSQRTLANAIASLANPVGVMVGNLMSPAIVHSKDDLPLLMELYTAPAYLATFLITFGMCSSLPPTPPTSSAAEVSEPFRIGVKKVLKNKSFWVLAFSFGAGIALFTVANTLMEQILCSHGYSDSFAGLCCALMIGAGVLGALIVAPLVDKSKKFEEAAKSGFALSAICLMIFLIMARYEDQEAVLATLVSLVGFFGFVTNPLSLELCVECTFPVSEATSAGIMIIVGQIQCMLYVMAMQWTARPYSPGEAPIQTCRTGDTQSGVQPMDYTVPNIGLSVIAGFAAIFYICAFKCDYKRLRAEQQLAAEEIIHHGNRSVHRYGSRDSPLLNVAQ